MIKIIFELSNEFIKDKANLMGLIESNDAEPDPEQHCKVLNCVAAGMLTELIMKGKTEFVISEDKLGEAGKRLLNQQASILFALAYSSSTGVEFKKNN